MFKRTFLFLLHIADAFWDQTNAKKAVEQLEKVVLQTNNPKAKEVFELKTFMDNYKSAGELIPIPRFISLTEETTEAELDQLDRTNKIFNSSEECKNQIKNAIEKIKTCTDCKEELKELFLLFLIDKTYHTRNNKTEGT